MIRAIVDPVPVKRQFRKLTSVKFRLDWETFLQKKITLFQKIEQKMMQKGHPCQTCHSQHGTINPFKQLIYRVSFSSKRTTRRSSTTRTTKEDTGAKCTKTRLDWETFLKKNTTKHYISNNNNHVQVEPSVQKRKLTLLMPDNTEWPYSDSRLKRKLFT